MMGKFTMLLVLMASMLLLSAAWTWNKHPQWSKNNRKYKGCGPNYVGCGCYKGSCWARCGLIGIDGWCFTNGQFGHTQNQEFVACKKSTDCVEWWTCGGACK